MAQGDPRILTPNGELISPSGNPAFGTPIITSFFDPDWAFGWGKRFANWEFSGGVQTQVKFLGSYPLPYGIQLSGTLQSLPGQEILANVTYTGDEISAGLGRTSNASTRSIGVIEPGTVYSDRLLQFDLRATKNLTFGPGKYRLMVDLYNVFNDSTRLELNNQYGNTTGGGTGWQRPQLIIPGRLVKFAFQIDF